MARRRTKSIRDIANQENRITRALGGVNAEASPRMARVLRAAQRYYNNIERTPAWQNAFNEARDRALSSPFANTTEARANAQTLGFAAADRVQVPQRTYMGLNEG